LRVRCFAFNTTMPTACKHLVSTSIFGELPIPLGAVREHLAVKLGIRGGNFKGGSSQAARNEDHLGNRVPGSYVHGTGRLAEYQIDRACVPFSFDQSARHTEAVGRTVQRGQEKGIQAGWRSPDIRQVKLEEVLLILAIEEAQTRLEALG
jgi:hypothetical protein